MPKLFTPIDVLSGQPMVDKHYQSKNIRQSRDIQLRYGNMQIDTVNEYKHLGIPQCNNRKTHARVDVA